MDWKCNTPGLFAEIMQNKGTAILLQPLNILTTLLKEVAERAIELDDPILNKLMFNLALYEGSLPNHPDYKALSEKIKKDLENL